MSLRAEIFTRPMDKSSTFFLSRWSRLVSPLAWIYGAVAARRRAQATARAISLPVPVVSVGNITVGGTGKTPVVELVVKELIAMGRRPAILSRGYKKRGGSESNGESVNDEFLVLCRNLPDVLHIQHPDRAFAGAKAVEAGADVLVLDDGFQHVRVRRDLDLVLLDATNPFGFGRVLPAGLLREPLQALDNADMFVLTRGRLVSSHKIRIIRSFLSSRFRGTPQLEIEFEPVAWVRFDGGSKEPLASTRGVPVAAFAGIGNPEGFRRQIVALGLRVVRWISFPDHHRYTRGESDDIQAQAKAAGARLVVTTQKDAVKIPWRHVDGDMPWRYLEIEPTATSGREVLRSRLAGLFND